MTKEIIINCLKKINEIYFIRNERDFTYELYHILRGLKLDIDVTAETPKSLCRIPEKLINSKFFKDYFFTSENYDVVNNSFNRTPYLLLHEYDNKNRQLLACEIKPLNQRNKLIYKDITKLLYYTESNLRYECGILILFSPRDNDMKLNKLKNKYQKALINFSKIEIWIIYPKRVHIIWSGGKIVDEIY